MRIPKKNVQTTVIDCDRCSQIIRDARKKKDMSLRKLATAMEISAAFLSDLERGNRRWTEIRFNQALECLQSLTK